MNGRKLTQDEKARVLELSLMGKKPTEIAEEMKLHPLRVSGTVRSLIIQGKLPAPVTTQPPLVPLAAPPPMQPAEVPGPSAILAQPPAVSPQPVRSAHPITSRPAPAPALHVPEPQAPAVGSDSRWSTVPAGQGSTYALPTQAVNFSIYRSAPQNDGLVGTQTTDPSDDELGRNYGHGVYRLVRQIPGRMPEHREVTISLAFGEPRYPRQAMSSRPGIFGRNPWGTRSHLDVNREQDLEDPRTHSPRPRPAYDDRDRMGEPRAPSGNGETSVAVTVVDKLSSLHERTLQQMEERARNGPDGFIQKFYESQQNLQQKRIDEERVRDDLRRQQDDERRRNWEQEQETRHRRDMERLKEERQTLIDLEKQRIELIKEEARVREEAYKREASEARELAREASEAAEERIAHMTENLEKRLQEDRASKDREHDLRSKALDNEHALKADMLKLREEMIKSKHSDDLTSLLGQLVEGVKGTVSEIVKLHQFQNASAEERAQMMAKQQQAEAEAAAAAAAHPQLQGPSGAPAASTPEPSKQSDPSASAPSASSRVPKILSIEVILRESMKSPVAQLIFSEWATALQLGGTPEMFSNTFFEYLRDETPGGIEARKACATFAQIMDLRDWNAMKPLLIPALPEQLRPSFELPNAADFYNAFRLLVCGQIKDYARAYLEQKQQQEAAARQASQPASGNGNGKTGGGHEREADVKLSVPEPAEAGAEAPKSEPQEKSG